MWNRTIIEPCFALKAEGVDLALHKELETYVELYNDRNSFILKAGVWVDRLHEKLATYVGTFVYNFLINIMSNG